MTRDELVKWIRKLQKENKLNRFYMSKEFLKLKKEVLEEQHYECQICKQQGIITKADTVHHNQFVTKYPELALSKFYYYKGKRYRNLISVCKACHNKLHPEKHKHKKKKLKQVTEERW